MQCLGRVGGELADIEAGIATTHLVISVIVIINLVIIVIVINLVIVVVINA